MWENFSIMIVISFLTTVAAGIFIILKRKGKTKKVSNLRFFIQIAVVIVVFMGLVLGPFGIPRYLPLGISPRDRLVGADFFGHQFPDGLSVPILACYYPNGRTVTCPVWQIQAYIFPFWNTGRGYDVFYSTVGLERLAIVFGLVIGMSIVLGRVFCGWLCPFGLYMDLITRIRKFFRIPYRKLSDETNSVLGQFRFVIIALFIILSFIFGSYTIFGTEIIPGTIPGGPLGTEAGIVGFINEPYCLVCPMRPLSILIECVLGLMNFSYISQITYGPGYIAGQYLTSINVTVLVLITILSFVYRRFWCRICPLGGLTALFSTVTPFKKIALTRICKNETKCTKCSICERVCPTQVSEVYEKKGGDVTVSDCMLCFKCVEMCPEKDALKVEIAGKSVFRSRNWLDPK